MADNMMLPIRFDLDGAVSEAAEDWKKKYASRLETELRKRKIKVGVELNVDDFDKIKERLNSIKIKPLSTENKAAIRGLAADLNMLAKALEHVQKYTAASVSKGGITAANIDKIKAQTAAYNELARQRSVRTAINEQKLANAREKANTSATAGTKSVTAALSEQNSVMMKLIKDTIAYKVLHGTMNFVTKIREITAEFELQRISLGAILQDQARANILFSQIKSFALQSPVKILDLTKYTKQLAAYKIGYDELFETTKRLTDVSVGLGVSMDRIILLYGQIRATGYLRACLGKDTPVMMYDGTVKAVQDIEIGDSLMGDNETPRKVSVLHRGVQQMYRVKYVDGEFRCNEHHKLTLYNVHTQKIEDVYVFAVYGWAHRYKGVKRINGKYEYFDFELIKDVQDSYFGFTIDGNKRFIICGNIVTHNSEVRQATEAGIPIVEELAKKLTAANGELVRAADVMDMISKREISFQTVKEVFEDMTSAGGIFYNMQEKQGNTLYGLWQKLGDAAAIMFDGIGNTKGVNTSMKQAVDTLRYLMSHWKQTGTILGVVSAAILVHNIRLKNLKITTEASSAANIANVNTLRARAAMLELECGALKRSQILTRMHVSSMVAATKAQISAATATNVFSKALWSLWAAIMANPFTMITSALVTLVALLYQSENELDKLESKLQDIDRDYTEQGERSIKRFKELVVIVKESVNGSTVQKNALNELNRTYSQILGNEALEINNLREMGDGYDDLIEMIEAYNAIRKGEEQETAIKSSYSSIMEEYKDDLKDYLNAFGLSEQDQIEFIQTINNAMEDGASATEATEKAFEKFANKLSVLDANLNQLNIFNLDKLIDAWGVGLRTIGGYFGGSGMSYVYNYAGAIEEQNKKLDEYERKTREAADACGAYSTEVISLEKALSSLDWSSATATMNSINKYNSKHPGNRILIPLDLTFDPTKAKSEYEKALEVGNQQINAIFQQLKVIAYKEGVEIPTEFYKKASSVVKGNKSFSVIDFKAIEKLFSSEHAKSAVRECARFYESIAPTNKTVTVLRYKLAQIAESVNVNLNKVKNDFMKSEEKIDEYAKRIKETIETLETKLNGMRTTNAESKHWGLGQEFSDEEIKNLEDRITILKLLFPLLESFTTQSHKVDKRLQPLQEIANKMAEINKEFEELKNKEGEVRALSHTIQLFGDSFKQMQNVANKYHFQLPEFKIPQTADDVKSWYNEIIKEIKRLNIKDAEKIIVELGFKGDKAVIDELQKKIEKQLKELANRVSNTKIAKDFYNKILAQTGDLNIAQRVTFSIYGDDSYNLHRVIAEQIREAFKTGNNTVDAQIDVKLDRIIDTQNARVNYMELAMLYDEYQDQIIEKNRDTAQKIIAEGQKTMADNILNWEKELAKAKTYEEQRTSIIQREAQRRAEIYKSEIPEEDKERLTEQSRRKEQEDLAKVNFEEFTKSDDYIRIFENLDYISTQTLKRLRERIQDVIKANDGLSPENMKTLVKAMNDVDNEINGRGFGNVMVSSVKSYIEATRSLRTAKQELAQAKADYEANVGQYDIEIAAAKKEEKDAQEDLNKLKGSGMATTTQLLAAQLRLNTAQQNAKLAEEKKAKAAKKVEDAEKKVENSQDNQTESTKLMWQDLENVGAAAQQLSGALSGVKDLLGVSEDSAAGIAFDSAISSLETVNKAIEIATAAQAAWNIVAESNPYLAIGTAVLAIGMALGSFFKGQKIAKANREIERQQELLEDLEHTYDRLTNAQDKLFGVDSVRNYTQQVKNLQAQQSAYLKQAEAERSKGKDADKAKIKEYEQAARDAVDEIKDLQSQLMETFTGSSITDVARTWAESFIDAKLSMEDTYAAMKEDYADLVKSFIVQGAAARIAESALAPLWDSVDKMLKGNDIDGAIDALVNGMDVAISTANSGLEGLWQALEKKGYDLRDVLNSDASDYTGIAKNVATATSEEINANTAALNTQNFYMATINENVAMIAQKLLIGGGMSTTANKGEAGWTDWQRQAMDSYLAIQRNTADAVVECRRTANACEATLNKINRVIVAKGNVSGVNVFTK